MYNNNYYRLSGCQLFALPITMKTMRRKIETMWLFGCVYTYVRAYICVVGSVPKYLFIKRRLFICYLKSETTFMLFKFNSRQSSASTLAALFGCLKLYTLTESI